MIANPVLGTLLPIVVIAVAACSADNPVAPRSTQLIPSAAAQNAAVRSTTPFTFVMAAGTCGLTTTVTGTGEYVDVFTVRDTPTSTGSHAVANLAEYAHGTASGADGSQYTFNYSYTQRWTDLLPGPADLTFVDNFVLAGQGAAPNIGVSVHGTVHIDANDAVTVTLTMRRGDITCDPI